MEMKKVKSSNVVAVGYDGANLIVEYAGGTYSYEKVAKKVYEGLLAAESKGRYMNSEIKGKYAYCKIK